MGGESDHAQHQRLKCEMCGEKFTWTWELQTHVCLRLAQQSSSNQCEMEGNNQMIKMTKQMLLGAGEGLGNLTSRVSYGKTLKCKLCSFRTTESATLAMHINCHAGEKPYKCSVCSYSTAWPSNLTKHQRIHTGEKPYQCEICNSSFSRLDSLKKHICSHTGE